MDSKSIYEVEYSNMDIYRHVRGESVYLDDIPVLQNTLYAAVFDSPLAHGKIIAIDCSKAEKLPGVIKVFLAKDIPGQNQIGGIIPDEELLASTQVHFCGMPIALVIAEKESIARAATKLIVIQLEALPVITDPVIAKEKNELIVPPRTFKIGNVEDAWKDCTCVVEGKAITNGQEHLYIETQGAYAIPKENGQLLIHSSTQGPTAVQRTIARVLNLQMHQIEVDTVRLGGGFGGKEDQATTWAVLCALAALHLQKPVKISLHRMDDMRMTGKRHPYTSFFKIGLNAERKIIAYEVEFYQNAGAAADLSPAVLERTLFHCTNTYFIPNVKATAYSCRTNLPPNTAFRGFGGPQGMFVIEAAIAKAAERLQIPAHYLQEQNLLQTDDEFPYGQKVVSEAVECWKAADATFHLKEMYNSIDEFNKENEFYKKGIAVMPICFGISFTKTMLNQARALVHVYTDGSVSVSTGAVEMGQGVNTKIMQATQQVFGITSQKITVHSTNTYRIANTSPSAASATADLNGKATEIACHIILQRLKQVASTMLNTQPSQISIKNERIYINNEITELSWQKLVMLAYEKRISLSEHAHYTPPNIHFDTGIEKGHPFAYHVFGTAIITTTVDCLRGIYEMEEVKVIHDCGKTMNEKIDRGQCEGGIVQGIGWMTMEEIMYDEKGVLKSSALSTYKMPDIYSVPRQMDIRFLETEKDNLALLKSKAVGEPPLMYGIGAYFAIRNAVKAFNPTATIAFDAPFTPEKVLMALYSNTSIK
jgi:xanthine dehydrogenase large subunit